MHARNLDPFKAEHSNKCESEYQFRSIKKFQIKYFNSLVSAIIGNSNMSEETKIGIVPRKIHGIIKGLRRFKPRFKLKN